jgi:hypothetical protein
VVDGDPPLAQREARAASALAAELGLPWLECLSQLVLAQVLLDGGDRRACEAQLRQAAAHAERLRSPLLDFAVRLGEACAAGEAASGHALAAALARGREAGVTYVPCWRPAQIAELCARALAQGLEVDYVAAMVRERRLVPREPPLRIRAWPWRYRVFTLGGFRILRGGEAVEFAPKGPGRPVELLKVLVSLGGQNVRAEQLADALWPHADADYAHRSFTATLHRLRRLLGSDEVLLLREGRLSLNASLVWVDTWALDQALAELEETMRGPATEAGLAAARRLVEELFSL